MAGLVYLGDALQYFVKNAHINIYQGNVAINLIDYLPLIKVGYANLSTMYLILLIYTKSNCLEDPTDKDFIIPDDLITKTFNSDISATFYDESGIFGKKILMTEAVNTGLVIKSLNTFEMIQNNDPTFNPLRFDALLKMVDLNIYTKKYIQNYEDYSNDININAVMNNENDFCANILNIILPNLTYEQGSTNITLHDFLATSIDYRLTASINQLIHFDNQNRNWIYLLYSIIIEDQDLVNERLNYLDPRINNNEAYKLALKVGNPEIIRMIRSKIIERSLLYENAFASMSEPIIGTSDIPHSLSSYYI